MRPRLGGATALPSVTTAREHKAARTPGGHAEGAVREHGHSQDPLRPPHPPSHELSPVFRHSQPKIL